jgi:hypothetical protein
MERDQVVLGGFQAVVLVVFLVQTLIEAVPSLQGRFTPVVALVVGLGVAAVIQLTPSPVQDTLGTGLALAAAASMTVRYVKRDQGTQAAATRQHEMSVGVVDFGRAE